MSDEPTSGFVTVKLSEVGRPQRFLVPERDPNARFDPGERIVVQTEQGPAFGEVVASVPELGPRQPTASELAQKVVRRATDQDVVDLLKQRQREQDAYRIGLMKIRERHVPMKLARVEQLFDGSRLVFYFTAEGRVDFRELVKELAAEFRTRIEMRQIGVRDEARMMGGYGSCGRPLCCTTWLHGFEPVSIKMAKQQELTLNPSKLSGLCGRLKCCLRYELSEPRESQDAPAPPRDECPRRTDETTPG